MTQLTHEMLKQYCQYHFIPFRVICMLAHHVYIINIKFPCKKMTRLKAKNKSQFLVSGGLLYLPNPFADNTLPLREDSMECRIYEPTI